MKIIADMNIPFVADCFAEAGDVMLVGGRDMTAEMVADADALLVRSITKVGPALLDGSKVKFVATATIGTDHVDMDYLARAGIGFSSAPGSNATSVAEYVVSGLLEMGRKHGFTLAGKSAGIIGVGNVGSRVERRLRALGMDVVLNDPPLARQSGDAKYRPLDEVLDCDFITMHTPLTREGMDATYHLAGREFFDKVKDGVVFINTSRGAVVDEKYLHAAIDAGRTGGLMLDVWENEPSIDTSLMEKADVVSPHVAGYSYDGKVAGLIMIYEAFCKHFGITPKHTAADFLPAPAVAEIVIDDRWSQLEQEEILRRCAVMVYDIMADAGRMRKITCEEPAAQGKYFDRLRKEYPVRREFENTRIVLTGGFENDKELAGKLAGIGFSVVS